MCFWIRTDIIDDDFGPACCEQHRMRTPQAGITTRSCNDCDLAIVEPDDQKFFEGMEPLEIGDLPAVRSTVVTIGYPAGGEQISYTKGVVSRIELQSYSHIGNRAYLAGQTDAARRPVAAG